VAVLALAPGAAAQIPLELRFDGRPFESAAEPEFTCFNATLGRWVTCRVRKAEGPGAWVLDRPEIGAYRLHVSVDANPTNPRRFPGDFEAQVRLDVTETGPARLVVELPKLIHLLRPGDNERPIEGMLTGCATQPAFATPRHAWWPTAKVEFAWEPVVTGGEYRYVLSATPCGRAGSPREVTRGSIDATAVELALPPSEADEHYVFRVEAWKDGRLAGDLYTHDSGTHSWNYRFQVRDASLPRWAYVATGSGLLLLLAVGYRGVVAVPRDRRRRRARRVAGATLGALLVAAGAGGGWLYYQAGERRREEAASAVAEQVRQTRQQVFAAAFAAVAPRPDWWEQVATPYRVSNVGDLLAAWQGHPRTDAGQRQFFKAAYQGIVDHPDDEHVVATALALLPHVAHDYPHRLGLARFGYERYFRHRARTDNCANCMVGDTTQGLTLNLSQIYAAAGRHDEALEVCRRLVDARGADVSPYKLAELWDHMAWLHWDRGEREQAVQVVREALARYGDTARGDDLKRTLAHFEREPSR
jgi:tetratricopeptide (TPR) repeat protein